MTYYYKAWEVDQETYDALELGGQHEGGVVVDGLSDGECDVPLLVTRHEGELVDWEVAYRELRGLIERCYSSVAIPKRELAMFIGHQQKLIDNGKAQAALTLTQELLINGAVFFTRRDDDVKMELTANMLVVRDRERFLKLPRRRTDG